MQWSRTRKRFERQGVLVEEGGLEQAERECLADADARERRREREADRRQDEDRQFVVAAGRALDPDAVQLAVVAAIRHEETRYDDLLRSGLPRLEARGLVRDDIDRVLDQWRSARDLV